jgi:hypothetical protein
VNSPIAPTCSARNLSARHTHPVHFPTLKPGLLLISLEQEEFYIGESTQGVYVPTDPYLAIVRACDGHQSTQSIADLCNLPHGLVLHFIDELRTHNLIELRNGPPARVGLDELANHYRDRIRPEHELFTWRAGTSDGGESEVRARKDFAILIFGQNRLARSLLANLQASGFSHTKIMPPVNQTFQRIAAKDICGITTRPVDIGRKQSEFHKEIILNSQLSHIQRHQNDQNNQNNQNQADGSSTTSPKISLAISTNAATSDYVQRWISEGTPHLQISQHTTHSLEIGPLVVPGSRACLNCVQLHRRDFLPPFIALAAVDNLAQRHGRELTSSSTSFVAGVITPYICEFAARGESSLVSHSLTIDLLEPLHGIVHHHWNVHPECGCGSSDLLV